MGNPRDDMVIKLHIPQRHEKPAQVRAKEERIGRAKKRRKWHVLRKLRRTAMARRASRFARTALRKSAVTAMDLAADSAKRIAMVNAAGGVGVGQVLALSAIIAEGLIQLGHGARILQGESLRMIQMNDQVRVFTPNLLIGSDMKSRVRAEFAARPDLLRMIKRAGEVPPQIAEWAADVEVLAKRGAIGSFAIDWDPYFDSRDSIIDRTMGKAKDYAREKGLPDLIRRVEEAVHKVTGSDKHR